MSETQKLMKVDHTFLVHIDLAPGAESFIQETISAPGKETVTKMYPLDPNRPLTPFHLLMAILMNHINEFNKMAARPPEHSS